MPNIIEEFRRELREKIAISHKITHLEGVDLINVDEKFKVKFIIQNKSGYKALIKKITIRDTKYAKVIGENSYRPNIAIEGRSLEPLIPIPEGLQPFPHGYDLSTHNHEPISIIGRRIFPKHSMETIEFEMEALDCLDTDEMEYDEPFANVIVEATFDPKDIFTVFKTEFEYTNIHEKVET